MPPPGAGPARRGASEEWDDEDEKTTVFDRAAGESAARALLSGSARPPARGASAPSLASKAPPPPPPATASFPSDPTGAPLQASVPPAVVRPSTAGAPALGSSPRASAPGPVPSAPEQAATFGSRPSSPFVAQSSLPPIPPSAASSYPVPPPPTTSSKKTLWLIGGALVTFVGLAFALFSGGGNGSLVVSVAGPGGKAVNQVSISIDGTEKCSSTPCVIENLEPKTHMVQVSATGYAEMAPRAVKVESGEEIPVNIELLKPSAGTGLSVTASAPGLKLRIDGKEIGPLPQDVKDLEPGTHEVEISGSPYFNVYRKSVRVTADEILKIDPELELIKGQLTVELGSNASGAEILLLGGKKPAKLHKLDLPQAIDIPNDGEYRVVATKSGFDDFEERVRFTVQSPEQTIVVSLSPKESEPSNTSSSTSTASRSGGTRTATTSAATDQQGTLNINSIPISNVILNGRPLGATPKVGVKVKPGNHTVVFVHAEKGRIVKQVSVEAGQTAVAVVKF